MIEIAYVFFLFSNVLSLSDTLTGTVNKHDQIITIPLNISQTYSSIYINFTITDNPLSKIVLVARDSPSVSKLTPYQISTAYFNQSLFSKINMDISSAIGSQPQIFNFMVNNNPTTIWLDIYNFDYQKYQSPQNYILNYRTLTVGKQCPICQYYSISNMQPYVCSCYCRVNVVGNYCSYNVIPMISDTNITLLFNQSGNVYFKFQGINPNATNVTLQILSDIDSTNTALYMQYQTKPQIIASPLNTYFYNQTTKFQIIPRKKLQKIPILTQNLSMTFTLRKTTDQSQLIYFKLTTITKQSDSYFPIILVIIGLILLFSILTILACVIRSKCRNGHRLQNVNLIKLTQQQIQLYFPTVSYSQISQNPQNNTSNQPINCIICLLDLQPTTLVRVTYCRHIFHVECLSKWFNKNQNCPFCRTELNRLSSQQSYQKLCQKVNLQLSGLYLVKEILQNKKVQKNQEQQMQIQFVFNENAQVKTELKPTNLVGLATEVMPRQSQMSRGQILQYNSQIYSQQIISND